MTFDLLSHSAIKDANTKMHQLESKRVEVSLEELKIMSRSYFTPELKEKISKLYFYMFCFLHFS